MRILTFLSFFLAFYCLSAQDTLRVMHYNLLDYGNASNFCNNNNNSTDQKDAWLRSIIGYSKPDIFTVNELSEVSTYHTRILNEVMNQTGYALFEMASSPNHAGSYIVNQLYYNSEKLALHSQVVAQDSIRDIDVYSLYSLNEGLQYGDTVFIHCIVAHLKSGDSYNDEQKRKAMTENALEYLEQYGRSGNYLFMGDFNVYEADDEAFQLMIANDDPVFRFYDPVDALGDWNNNIAFRQVHTQCTRIYQTGCGAYGGMDDRFDFILVNEVIKDHADRVHYLDDTYRALGQDGNRLNGSIVDPPNTSLPAYVLDALFHMSDHLPVVMDVVVDASLGISDIRYRISDVRYQNPVKDKLNLRFGASDHGTATLRIISASGKLVYQEQRSFAGGTTVSIPTSHLTSGIYFLRIDSAHLSFTGKLIVIK